MNERKRIEDVSDALTRFREALAEGDQAPTQWCGPIYLTITTGHRPDPAYRQRVATALDRVLSYAPMTPAGREYVSAFVLDCYDKGLPSHVTFDALGEIGEWGVFDPRTVAEGEPRLFEQARRSEALPPGRPVDLLARWEREISRAYRPEKGAQKR